MGKAYDLEERLLDFAAAVIRLVERLPNTRAGNHVAGQLLLHKMRVAYKELRETRRWIRLIKKGPLMQPATAVDPDLREVEELIRIFFSSIRTAEDNDDQ